MSDPPPLVIASIAAVVIWYGLLALCAYLVRMTGDPRVLRYLAEVIAAARRQSSDRSGHPSPRRSPEDDD